MNLRALFVRLLALFRRRRLEEELSEDIRAHLEMATEENLRRGMNPREALAAARRGFGGVEQMKEAFRDQRGIPTLESVIRDARFGLSDLKVALRTLRRTPASSVLAVFTLAIGIGTTAAIFTLVNAILFHPLPYYADPDRIVMLWSEHKEDGWDHERMSFAELAEWEGSGIFERVVGFVPNMRIITAPGEPERVHSHVVTAGALPMLGAQPLLGRAFTADEEMRNGPPSVILLHGIWMRRYGGDRTVIGQTIDFDGVPHSIVGVMPPDFQFFNRQSDLLFPLNLDPQLFGTRRILRVMARLRPGVSLRQAQEEANIVSSNLAREYPGTNNGWTMSLVPLPVDAAGEIRAPLLVLLGAGDLVMLIACSNVVSLLLVRLTARSKELAVRMALGAKRWQLVRQILAESLLLAAAGTIPGILIARAAVHYFRDTLPDRFGAGRYLVQLDQIQIDASVLVLVVTLVPVSAVLVGLLPALKASRPDLNEALKETARGGSSSRSTRRMQSVVVVMQIAVTVLLLVGAGLLIQTFAQLYREGPGFRPDNLKTASLQLPVFAMRNRPPDEFQSWVRTSYEMVMSRIAALPGIEAVASVNDLPLSGFYWLADFTIENRIERRPNDAARAIDHPVSPSYFETLGVPLLTGRYFNSSDGAQQPRVAIVNDVFVREYLLDDNPVGRRVKAGGFDSDSPWHTIVGVVAAERIGQMNEEPRPIIYFSALQNPQPAFNLIVRSRMSLSATLGVLRAELGKIDPRIAPYAPRTFDALVLDSTWRVRYSMLLLGVLAAVSLAMALGGVYGIMSYGVSERMSEIGIRMAFGCQPNDIVKLITVEAMRLALAGVALGLVCSAALTKFLSSLLFGVDAIDGPTYVVVAVLIVGVAALAAYAPARRAAGLDPLRALRCE